MAELLRKPRNALTHEQRMAALGRANAKRADGKALRALLRAQEVDPLALLRGDLEPFERVIADWKIERLLRAIPGMGPNRTFVVLSHQSDVRPSDRVRDLSFETRASLAALVNDVRMLRL